MNSGQIIKELIRERGLKQKWIANKLGIASPTLNEMLKKNLTFENVIQICQLINITLLEYYELYQQKRDVVTSAKNTTTSQSNKVT